MVEVHTLVIGGGPSGSSCAIAAARRGLSTCLVEARRLPRVKLCAGLFTGKSQQALLHLLGDDDYATLMRKVVCSEETYFALFDGMKCLVSCTPYRPIVLIDRPEFDYQLTQYYTSIGGTLIEGDALVSVDFDAHVATLQSGKEVKYQYLVAADGANSKVEHLLTAAKGKANFKPKTRSAMCIEVNVDRQDLPDASGVCIHFGIVPDSYAWSFAKGEKVCLGLVKLVGQTFNAQQAMTKFMTDLGVRNIDRYPLRGAMLPFGNIMPRPVCGDVYFVGDAAGLVEPLTGEGIYYALQSGIDAGESVGDADEYLKRNDYLVRLIRKGGKYQKMLEMRAARQLFVSHASRHPGFITHFYSTQIDEGCLDSFFTIWRKYRNTKRHHKD